MRLRILAFVALSSCLVFFLNNGCTKIDTTALGSDLIPVVDNINTFADTLNVESTQGFFDDSTLVTQDDVHALGYIGNDPLFGKTNANIFLQLKPTFYPYSLQNAGDTLVGLDSVVLCLSFKGAWGDSIPQQQIEVRKIEDLRFRDRFADTNSVKYAPTVTDLLGSSTFDIKSIKGKRFINNGRDSVVNQLRIKLTNSAFNQLLYNSDTLQSNPGLSNAFRNDSTFRKFFNGLGIISKQTTGNALMYFSLLEKNTRMEIHFRKKKNGIIDTLYRSLYVAQTGSGIAPSGTANNITRNRSGFPVSTPSTTENYIQTAPGTFVDIKIPRLNTFKDTNKIIHRAVLIVEQVPSDMNKDLQFTPPSALYIDLKDDAQGANFYKPLYFDLNPSAPYRPDVANQFFPPSVDQNYFGGFEKYRTGGPTGRVAYYNLNLTRYLQQMVTSQKINYQLRLYAPVNIRYKQFNFPDIPYQNTIALGRIKVGSGANPDYRMRVAIIWSKIKS